MFTSTGQTGPSCPTWLTENGVAYLSLTRCFRKYMLKDVPFPMWIQFD